VSDDRLRAWIEGRHLEESALGEYRRSFTTHAARLLIIRDFLVPEVALRLSRFLSAEAEYRVEHGLYSVEGAVSEEDFQRAPDEDRLFRLGKLTGTPPQFRASPNALTYLQFRMTFQRPELRAFFESVSGMSLGWSDDFGAHAMGSDDLLRPHSDDNKDRQLALVIYLTPQWRPEHGGVLRVIHADGGHTDVVPEYNSVIAFDVLTAPAHLVSPVTRADGAERRRLSIGGWYRKAGAG
jgi:hypothetical protein